MLDSFSEYMLGLLLYVQFSCIHKMCFSSVNFIYCDSQLNVCVCVCLCNDLLDRFITRVFISWWCLLQVQVTKIYQVLCQKSFSRIHNQQNEVLVLCICNSFLLNTDLSARSAVWYNGCSGSHSLKIKLMLY